MDAYENKICTDVKIKEKKINVNTQVKKTQSYVHIAPNLIRSYIAMAREYKPYISEELTEWLVALYVDLRKEDSACIFTTYTTTRTLLSIIRISQANARLRLSEVVSNLDIEESLHLMRMCKESLQPPKEKENSKT